MSCDSGMYERSGVESQFSELTQYTPLGGTLWVWRHELEWEWSECVSDCTRCVPLISNSTVDNANYHSYSVQSDKTITYEGNVSNSLDIDNGETPSTVTSFRQDKYDSSVPYISGCNPWSELEGDTMTEGKIVDHSNGC